MKIALDIMGGDYAPKELIAGALEAKKEIDGLEIVLVGSEEAVKSVLITMPPGISAVYSATVMGMDEPIENVRRKRDSSIFMATDLVRQGEVQAVISAGSTGAQMAAALLLIGRIPGIHRPAILIPYPTLEGNKILLDGGANVEADGENLFQFALLGAGYGKILHNMDAPKIALLSNGSEAHKGTKAVVTAHAKLAADEEINFIGNVEGRDLMKGDYDVVVCDGFSGNIVLKLTEGVASALFRLIKDEITSTVTRKIGAALVKPGLMELKKRFDYSEYGGAPLLGIKGLSIVCHGSSKRAAIKNAFRTAADCLEKDFVGSLSEFVSNHPTAEKESE